MPRYSCDPHAEVMGQTALALLTNLQADAIRPILEKHNLTNINPDQWYPVQKVLDVLNDVSESAGAMWDFVAVGMAAAELGYQNLSPTLKGLPLDEFLLSYGVHWDNRHRNLSSKGIKADKVGAKHVQLTLNVPYPDDLLYGIFYNWARRLLPKGTDFSVKYDDKVARKEQGGTETILHVSWS